MQLSGSSKWLLRLGTAVTLLFLYIPLIVIALYAFNSTRVQKWPPAGLTLDWFSKAFDNQGVRDALWTSVRAGVGATAVAPSPARTLVHSASRTPGLSNAFENQSNVSPAGGHFCTRVELNA